MKDQEIENLKCCKDCRQMGGLDDEVAELTRKGGKRSTVRWCRKHECWLSPTSRHRCFEKRVQPGPCLFPTCGNPETLVERFRDVQAEEDVYVYAVLCPKCQAQGPWAETHEDAVREWDLDRVCGG